MKRISLLTVVLLLPFSFSTSAQRPNSRLPQPEPEQRPQPAATPQQPSTPGEEDIVRITTNLVQVDAVITDKSGHPITDLKPEEVEILEDGKPQKISHFSYVVTTGPSAVVSTAKPTTVDKSAPPAPPVTLKADQVRRTIAIVVDDLGLSFESVHFVRKALKTFLDEQMQPGDLVAIVRTAGGNGALQQFTTDKALLYAAVEHIRWYASGRGGVTASAPIEDSGIQNPPPSNDSSPGATATPDAATDFENANTDLNEFRDDVFSIGTLGEVGYVVNGLRAMPGRKSILLISDGFRIHSKGDPTREYEATERAQRLIDEAARASVVIYTLNPTGLQTLGLTARDYSGGYDPTKAHNQIDQQLQNRRDTAFEVQEGLDYLADETGGIAIRNTNNLSNGIQRVMEDQKGYYLIGYRPDESTFDRKTGRRTFHKLSVKVTRAGKFEVRMRNGFYGVTDEEAHATARTPQDQVVEALTSPFHTSGVHLQLTSAFANSAQQGSFLRTMLHIDANDLTFTVEPDGSHKSTFNVVVFTFGADTGVVDQTGRTYTIRIPAANYDRTLKNGFVYYLTVPIKKPGAYQLRAAVRDEKSQRVGSASQFLVAPDVKKPQLTLSGLLVAGISPEAYQEKIARRRAGIASSPPSQDGEDQVDQTDPEASPALRHFHQGLIMEFTYVIYNPQLDKSSGRPQLQTRLRMFRDGRLVFAGKEEPFKVNNPPDMKRLNVSGAIHLGANLEPGEYVFQVVVTDLLAEQKHRVTSRWIDFEIVK
jgi:VWFA-related protein